MHEVVGLQLEGESIFLAAGQANTFQSCMPEPEFQVLDIHRKK